MSGKPTNKKAHVRIKAKQYIFLKHIYFTKSLLIMEHIFYILNIHKKTKSSVAFDELTIP